jgi:restriction system protein
MDRRRRMLLLMNQRPQKQIIVESAPPFSFSAIVKVERTISDGQIITLLDPAYSYLIDLIGKNNEIIYQIDPRKWEELIAAAYDKAGFDEVILTPRSGDYGRDVIAIKKGFGSVKFIDQVKAYKQGHIVTADEVRALLGVLSGEQDASKAIFTTTSVFAPKIEDDKFIKPFLPYRLELVNKEKLIARLLRQGESG